MKLLQTTAAVIGALAMASAGAANVQQPQQPLKQSQPMGQASKFDRRFVQEAAQQGQGELALAQVAEQKAQSPEAKRLAQELVTSHSQANQQLSQLAFSKNIDIATEPSAAQRSRIQSIEKLQGERFDKEFLTQAAKDHRKSLSLFEKAARNSEDPDIKGWAQKMIPTLEQHLAMAQRPTAVGEAPRGQSPQRQQPQRMPQQTAPY